MKALTLVTLTLASTAAATASEPAGVQAAINTRGDASPGPSGGVACRGSGLLLGH